MLKFIRNHQKKLLAVFGVLLMVIFIIPPNVKNGRGVDDRVVAHIGEEPIMASERDQAEAEWQLLSRNPRFLQAMGEDLATQLDQHPELFLLLQKEAVKEGVVISDKDVATMTNNLMGIASTDVSPEADLRRAAMRGFLLVYHLREQLASSVKYSQPMWTHLLAEAAQKAKLSLVTFKADQFKATVPTPTPEQIRKEYDALKNVVPPPPDIAPGNPYQLALPENDSLGFGYELPRRVKLQYVEIPRRSLLDAVGTGKSAYDWDVAARRYYYAHVADFPSTLPGTNPTTLPAKSYDQVKQDIVDQLRGPDADALGAKVRDAILIRMNQDFVKYVASTQPGTPPASQPASAFAADHELEQMALDIQKQFGVLPIVRNVSDWESAQDLGQELGIGHAKTADGLAFADYAIGSDDPDSSKGNMPILEPSTWLSDAGDNKPSDPAAPASNAAGNSYIFRLTAVAPAAPAPLVEVQTTVASDWITQQAYDLAIAAAKDLAKKAKGQPLPAIAMANGRPAYNTAYFQPQEEAMAQGPSGAARALHDLVEERAQPQVVSEAQKLLGLATAEDPRPIGIVEVPQLRQVVVVQLAGIQSALPPDNLWRQQLMQFAQYGQGEGDVIARQYFAYDSVVQRLDYKVMPNAKGS